MVRIAEIAIAVVLAFWIVIAGTTAASAGVSLSVTLTGPATDTVNTPINLTATYFNTGAPVNVQIDDVTNPLSPVIVSTPVTRLVPSIPAKGALTFSVTPATPGTHIYRVYDADGKPNFSVSNQISVNVTAPQTITTAHAGQTIQNFLNDRGDVIAGTQPLQPQSSGQFTGSLTGGTAGTGSSGFVESALQPIGSASFAQPLAIRGQMDGDTGEISAFASLNQIAAAARANQDTKDRAALGLSGSAPIGGPQHVSPYNVWVEVAATAYSNSSAGPTSKGSVGVAYLGSDYLINRAVRIGWISQFDWASEKTEALNSSAHGTGWMSGPFIAMHLTPNLTFDGRAAWGRSSNQVDPVGTYTDDFATERTLLFGRLTGQYDHGAWRLLPSAEIVRFQDHQLSYTDSKGVVVPDRMASIGQFTFGPRISYVIRHHDGSMFEPFVALKGVWTFERTANITAADDFVAGGQPFTGKLEAGAKIWIASGVTLEGLGAIDNLGDSNAPAYRGQASIRVPLN